MSIAYCIGCGCHDFAACEDPQSGDACSWLVVDYDAQRGVCSACPTVVDQWEAGDRQLPRRSPQ